MIYILPISPRIMDKNPVLIDKTANLSSSFSSEDVKNNNAKAII
jgi:hypothetical protein